MTRHDVGYSKELHDFLAKRKVFLSSTGRYRDSTRLVISEAVAMEPYSGIYAGTALCSIGSFSYSRSGVKPGMRIGRYCSIASGLMIGGTRHPIEWATSSNISYERKGVLVKSFLQDYGDDSIPLRVNPGSSKGDPKIGNDVWIAQNVILNEGVTIGDGAVIAAGSVVTKDVEPYTVVGGNKAVPIRKRFEPEQIAALSELAWWNYDPSTILNLDIRNPDNFIAALERVKRDVEPYNPRVMLGSDILRFHSNTAPPLPAKQSPVLKWISRLRRGV